MAAATSTGPAQVACAAKGRAPRSDGASDEQQRRVGVTAAARSYGRLLPALLLIVVLALSLAVRGRERSAPRFEIEEVPTPAGVDDVAPRAEPFPLIEPADAAPQSVRAPVVRSEHFLIYVNSGSYSAAEGASIAEPLELALSYVEQRTGMRLSRAINVVFDRRPDTCGLDAVAYTNARTLIVYTCSDTPRQRAINVLAHELVHQLAHDRYGDAHLQADLILSEGLATWGAGRYWLGGEQNFRDFVGKQYTRRVPLATGPDGSTTTDMLNQLYYQWASYIEWLEATYGTEAVARLYAAGTGRRPGSAGYEQVLGTPFEQTEERWRAWIE